MGTTADKLTYLAGTKTAIKAAIQAKGVSISDTDTFRAYAEKISAIPISGFETEWAQLPAREGNTITVGGVPQGTTHMMLTNVPDDYTYGSTIVPLIAGQSSQYTDYAGVSTTVYVQYDVLSASVVLSTTGNQISATHYRWLKL